MKKTPLYPVHLELGAKMVDFAGWGMPVHYGSQVEEHRRVRADAGMFDVSHMLVIDVDGPAAVAYLRYVLANDVARLERPGKALYTCMLREDGGVLDDLIVYARPAGAFRLVVNAGTADKDLEWLQSRLAEHAGAVELRPRRDLAIIAVQGPAAPQKLWSALPEAREATSALASFEAAELGERFFARTGYTGEDGFEVITPASNAETLWRGLLQAEVAPAGLGARDTLRLEAGMNLYGQDMDEATKPLEAGLAWTVDMKTTRDFIGRHALENTKPSRKLVGLVLEDRGVMRTHQRVRTSTGEGEVTSGGYSPTMNRSIALARVPVSVAASGEVEVEVRDKWLKARVVKPPFVRHGTILV